MRVISVDVFGPNWGVKGRQMKEWFYVKHPDGRRMVYRTDVVVGVRETDTGVMILFKDQEQLATDSYDLPSFVSNVLEEDDLLKALDDSAN